MRRCRRSCRPLPRRGGGGGAVPQPRLLGAPRSPPRTLSHAAEGWWGGRSRGLWAGPGDPPRPRLPGAARSGSSPRLGGAGLAPLWRGGERRAPSIAARARLLAAAAAPGRPRSRDAADARDWRAAQRLRGHVRWPRPPATMSLTARVSCSMLSCFVSAGPACGGPGTPTLAAPAAFPRAGP